MRKTCIKATQMIFAYGMSVLLVVCFLAALAYVTALIIGQPGSVAIHQVVSGRVFPLVYYGGILLSFDGMLHLYLKGELLFRLDLPKHPGKKEKK